MIENLNPEEQKKVEALLKQVEAGQPVSIAVSATASKFPGVISLALLKDIKTEDDPE